MKGSFAYNGKDRGFMKHMNKNKTTDSVHTLDGHTLKVLEFSALLEILSQFAASQPGRKACRALIPLTDRKEIIRLIAETTEMKTLLELHTCPPLGGINDVQPLLDSLPSLRSPLEPSQLNQIAETLETAGRLKAYVKQNQDALPRLRVHTERIADFSGLTTEIRRCIDEEGEVRDNASPKLNEARRSLKRLQTKIQDKILSIMNAPEYQNCLENRNLLTRGGRPVLAVKAGFRREIPGTLLDKSNTGATMFIEPHGVSELVNEMEDVRFEERREVQRILWELSRSVAEQAADIGHALVAMTHIDLTYAKARFSIDFAMISPEIMPDMRMILQNVRHPLLMHYAHKKFDEQGPERIKDTSERVVPMTVRLGDDFNLLIITGPNTGGKTVALKTVGLIVLMAQSGMHIPADWQSKLPVFNRVYSDIGDEQSIEQSLSTFSSHMINIVHILRNADSATLVLLDELGSGTDPVEGAALGTSIMDYLRSRDAKVIVTTHLGELKTYAYSTPLAENASMEFNRKTFLPTYRLLLGQPGSSNAMAIVRQMGMPESVLAQTQALLAHHGTGASDLINKVQETRVAAERSRREADVLKKSLEQSISDARQETEKAHKDARAFIELTVNDIESVVDDYVNTARNAPAPWGDKSRELQERIVKIAAGTPLSVLHARYVESLREGDRVYAVPFQSYGTVRKILARQRQMRLEIEGVVYEVPFSQIREKPFVIEDTRSAAHTPSRPEPAAKPKEKNDYEPVLPEKQKAFIESLSENDKAYSPALKSVVTIKKVNHTKATVIARVGLLEIELPFNKIYPLKKNQKEES